MENCIFCKIIKGEIPSSKIYEDQNVFVFLDINPITIGHCLVIPKEHSDDIFDTKDEALKDVIIVGKIMSKRLKEKLGATAVNLVNSSGKDAEQGVPHFHLHVIPRYENDELHMADWWQSKVKKFKPEELKRLAEKINNS